MSDESRSLDTNKPTGGVTIGNVEGGIRDSTIAGRDVNIGQKISNFFFGDTEQQRALRNRRGMLELVRNTWVKGVLEQSLHGAAMIELGMEERPEAVEHPWDRVVQAPDRPNRALPPGTKIVDVLDEMNGAMLILGEPGSGKTMLLLELARDTLARAESDPTQPIPVVFNLSAWSEKRPSIADWLVEELGTKYNIPKKIAHPWVEKDDLMLLLDGLDEVRPEHREMCVRAINDFRQSHLMALVVSSRIADYEALTTRLKLQGAVSLQPLTLEQVEQFILRAGLESTSVRETLEQDTQLRELAQSPLMLSIITLTFQGLLEQDLQSHRSMDPRRYLFDAYLQQMFKRRGGDPGYSQEQTLHRLAWLAQKMTQNAQTVFLIERMQPEWLPTQLQKWLYAVTVMLLTGLPIGLLVGWAAGFPIGITDLPTGRAFGVGIGLTTALTVCLGIRRAFGLMSTLVVGSLFGVVFGIPFGTYFGPMAARYVAVTVGLATGGAFALIGKQLTVRTVKSWGHVEVVETLSWSWSKALLGFVIGSIAGFLFGFTIGQAIWKSIGSSFGIAFGLAAGLVAGVLSGLTTGEVEVKTSSYQGIWRSARNAVRVGWVMLLAVGLPIGIATGLAWKETFLNAESLTVGVTLGLTIGLAFGITVGLFFGGLAVIKHLTLRFILHLNGNTPWNYARFLDYAAERIFLRKVGGGYIFVHRLLMEYFASLEDTVKAS